jgi:aryl-alcohol dehydrogenase-like predicted oxidoreductase
MNFGGPTSEEESIRIIDRALNAGINFIDTANVYNDGVSEEIVGRALKGKRDRVVLATKVHGRMGDGPNDRGNSRYHIMAQAEASLKRLQTDHIDLYQLHRPDPDTPLDEQMSALNDLVRQGKVRYLGTSTFPAWELCQALWSSDRNGFERIVCEQPPYSIFSRQVELRVLRFCKEHGIGVIPWSPLAGGWLTGKYRKGKAAPEDSRGGRRGWELETPTAKAKLDAVEALIDIADGCDATLSQFALAWVLANPVVTAPIIGPRTVDQLEDNLGALDVSVTADIRKAVDDVVAPGADLTGHAGII